MSKIDELSKHRHVLNTLESIHDASKELNEKDFQYYLKRINEVTESMIKMSNVGVK